MVEKVLDKHIRESLHTYLRNDIASAPGSVVIDELVLQQKDGRADVAVVNDHFHCYEIKSDADTLERLKRQVKVYGKVFDYLSVVVTEKHFDKAAKALPKHWGTHIWFPKEVFVSAPKVVEMRAPTLNPGVQISSLTQLLWRDSALALLREVGAAKGVTTRPKWFLWKHIQETCTHPQVHHAVMRQYKTHRRLAEVN